MGLIFRHKKKKKKVKRTKRSWRGSSGKRSFYSGHQGQSVARRKIGVEPRSMVEERCGVELNIVHCQAGKSTLVGEGSYCTSWIVGGEREGAG